MALLKRYRQWISAISIEALDSNGKVIRRYEPICVPKWQTEESALPLTMGNLSNTDVELTKQKMV